MLPGVAARNILNDVSSAAACGTVIGVNTSGVASDVRARAATSSARLRPRGIFVALSVSELTPVLDRLGASHAVTEACDDASATRPNATCVNGARLKPYHGRQLSTGDVVSFGEGRWRFSGRDCRAGSHGTADVHRRPRQAGGHPARRYERFAPAC